MDTSIFHLVGLVFPCLEGGDGFVGQEFFHGLVAVFAFQGQFVVDERVVEADAGGVGFVVAVIDFVQMGPVDGSQAHGTGLARGIDFASAEVERVQLLAGGADGAHFGMGRRVVVGRYAVHARGYYLAVFHDDGSERTSAVLHIFDGKLDGFPHEVFFFHQ